MYERRSISHGGRGIWVFPDLPRGYAARIQVLEHLFVLKRIHRHPEAVVTIRCKLSFLDETMKRLLDQFLAVVKIFEDLTAKYEVAAVDVNPGARYVLYSGDLMSIAHRDDMKGVRRLNAEERRDLPAIHEVLDHCRQ